MGFTSHEAATTLVHQLGCLPLALVKAGISTNKNSIALEAYNSLHSTQEDSPYKLLNTFPTQDSMKSPVVARPERATSLHLFNLFPNGLQLCELRHLIAVNDGHAARLIRLLGAVRSR